MEQLCEEPVSKLLISKQDKIILNIYLDGVLMNEDFPGCYFSYDKFPF